MISSLPTLFSPPFASLPDGGAHGKTKVSQLDKNLEQLTVMYHKLVYQNNALRKENEVRHGDLGCERKREFELH